MMTKDAYPVLCGGTFLVQLLESKKRTTTQRQRAQGTSDAFSEQDVLHGLVRIVQPDFVKPAGKTFKTYTSYFKRCAENTPLELQFSDKAVESAFLLRLESDYPAVLNEMTGFVNTFIEVGTTSEKDTKLVKRLIDMIVNDKGDPDIPHDYQFAIDRSGATITKDGLPDVTSVYLPAFLLSVWTFIVTRRKENDIGAGTISAWSTKVQGRYKVPEADDAAKVTKVESGVYIPPVIPDAKPIEYDERNNTPTEKFKMPDVYPYLRKTEERYKNVISFARNDRREFDEIYVCNDISFSPHYRRRRINHVALRRRGQIMSMPDAKSIVENAKFAMLFGTGGLGKSMMMRHIFLNANTNYGDLGLFPVFVTLRGYGGADVSLFDYIYTSIAEFDDKITRENFESMLDNGVCLLLLDGLDEIGMDIAERFESEIEKFTNRYSKNAVIISSRPFDVPSTYERFSSLWLMPLDLRQASLLIDKIAFREDETIVKANFLKMLNGSLFQTHREFAENPLLLTIMLLTYTQFGEVPSETYKFYRDAFEALARTHDANKSSYKRKFRTRLSIDDFKDCFAELCFLSYEGYKYELTIDEFTHFFSEIKEFGNEKIREKIEKVKVRDFIVDVCSNLCLMFYEGGSYHFAHRSFQEYLCAYYLSKLSDEEIAELRAFFDNRLRRRYMFGERTFDMLYDMIPERVETYIFLPALKELFDKCDRKEGYWTFLEEMHPRITYTSEDADDFVHHRIYEPRSFILGAILDKCGFVWEDDFIFELPGHDSLVERPLMRSRREAITDKNGDVKDYEYYEEEVGFVYRFDVDAVRQSPDVFADLLQTLDDDQFILKKQYQAAKKYMDKLIVAQETRANRFRNRAKRRIQT